MRESVGTRVIGKGSLISCMTYNIPYRIVLFMWNMIGCFMYAITCIQIYFYKNKYPLKNAHWKCVLLTKEKGIGFEKRTVSQIQFGLRVVSGTGAQDITSFVSFAYFMPFSYVMFHIILYHIVSF